MSTIGLTARHKTMKIVCNFKFIYLFHVQEGTSLKFNYYFDILEIGLLAACGELFELSFDLPFFEFLPTTVLFKFWIQIEGGDLNFYVPEVSTAYIALDSLTKNAKVRNRDGSVTWNSSTTNNVNVQSSGRGSKVKKWRNICQTRY
jgi:hypothetical protein